MELLIAPALDHYIQEHTRSRPALFDELRDVTYASTSAPQMQVGRVEGTFLEMLVGLMGARRVLEIGTFTGYSALSMAEGLPDDGELVTCDIDPETTKIARAFFDRAPWGKKITLRLGDARETLRTLPADRPFDLAFIDADKSGYVDYYEAILPLLRPGGLIVADNTLWSGKVLDPKTKDDHAIVRFNAHVQADARVENVLLSVRDGMMLARKR
jgi:caffeoyl-CoA O-methyltransferase